jgi:PPOX class probable F420-dependent enzyme
MTSPGPYRAPIEPPDGLSDPLVQELLESNLIANLATLNADGTIHVVPLWYLWRAPNLLLPTSRATRKTRNLERDPRATIMIDDSRGGFDLRGVTLVGEVTIDRGPGAPEVNREIHLRYLTQEGRELPEVDRYLGTDDVTIRFLPVRLSAWDLRETPQGRAVAQAGAGRPLGEGFTSS